MTVALRVPLYPGHRDPSPAPRPAVPLPGTPAVNLFPPRRPLALGPHPHLGPLLDPSGLSKVIRGRICPPKPAYAPGQGTPVLPHLVRS